MVWWKLILNVVNVWIDEVCVCASDPCVSVGFFALGSLWCQTKGIIPNMVISGTAQSLCFTGWSQSVENWLKGRKNGGKPLVTGWGLTDPTSVPTTAQCWLQSVIQTSPDENLKFERRKLISYSWCRDFMLCHAVLCSVSWTRLKARSKSYFTQVFELPLTDCWQL